MATAYESDCDLPESRSMSCSSSGAGCHRNVSAVVSGDVHPLSSVTITCMQQHEVLYPKSLCCDNEIRARKHPQNNYHNSLVDEDNGSECCHSNSSDFSTGSNQKVGSEIVSLLSEYHNYVEHIKAGLLEQGNPVEQIRLSLQYLPCLESRPGKQPVFTQSSPIVRARNVESLLEGLDNVSSWYNHGLMTHLFVSMVGKNGAIKNSNTHTAVELADQYSQMLNTHWSNKLSLLPAVASGPRLPEDFEELKVTVLKTSITSYTLGEVMDVHKSLADILGLKRFVVLFQGIAEGDSGGSDLVFWIPKSVASSALTNAYKNETKMAKVGMARIQAQYETVLAKTKNGPTESGYETQLQSNTTDDSNNPFFSFSSHNNNKAVVEEEDEEDEVFITQVSPDSLTTSGGGVSVDLPIASDTSSLVSGYTYSILKSKTPTSYAQPPVCSKQRQTTPLLKVNGDRDSNCDKTPTPEGTFLRPKSKDICAIAFGSGSGKQINLDLEILQEIERQNSISSPFDDTKDSCITAGSNDTEMPYITMNPAGSSCHSQINSKSSVSVCSSQLSSYLSPQAHSTPCKPQPQAHSTACKSQPQAHSTPCKPQPKYLSTHSSFLREASQTRSFQSQNHYSRTPSQTRAFLYHHYRNIPFSYTSIPHNKPIGQRLPYRIVPARPSGFIKRVLLRSSKSWPANLQMIVISGQEANEEEGKVTVKSGQRVLALYAENNDVIIKTLNGGIGRVPYSFCRVSKAFYGVKSKTSSLASLKLYNISTLCIESDSPRGHSPTPVDMIAIKRHIAQDQQRDEVTVCIGEQVRLLYSDEEWIYGSLKTGQSGFIPRDCCRLGRKSEEMLISSGWLVSSLPFQSDFIFDLHEPPPRHLLNLAPFPNKEKSAIVMLIRNYTPPGTQVVVRKGLCVKTIYTEDQFNYVATISGSSFWIPAPFTVTAPKSPALPMAVCGLNESAESIPTLLSPIPKLRPRANTVSYEPEKGSPKKKVSFATGNPMVFRESMGSNPELSVTVNNQSNYPSKVCPITPTQRAHSNENLSIFMLLLCGNSPEISKCGCFSF